MCTLCIYKATQYMRMGIIMSRYCVVLCYVLYYLWKQPTADTVLGKLERFSSSFPLTHVIVLFVYTLQWLEVYTFARQWQRQPPIASHHPNSTHLSLLPPDLHHPHHPHPVWCCVHLPEHYEGKEWKCFEKNNMYTIFYSPLRLSTPSANALSLYINNIVYKKI